MKQMRSLATSHQQRLKMASKQQHKQKHVPMRSCVACRQKMDKRRLTRIVRTADAGVVIDPTGKLNGRGAYLCDDPACWQRAVNNRIVDSALKTELTGTERQMILTHVVSAEIQAQHV